jgi:hypothetical protein
MSSEFSLLRFPWRLSVVVASFDDVLLLRLSLVFFFAMVIDYELSVALVDGFGRGEPNETMCEVLVFFTPSDPVIDNLDSYHSSLNLLLNFDLNDRQTVEV